MRGAEIQTAVYSRLNGDSALGGLISGVYDHVPQEVAFPYVVVGDGQSNQWDTDTSLGAEHTIELKTWSRYRGRKEVKDIQQAIYDSLHRHSLSVSGASTVTCEWEMSETFKEPDGLTRQGVDRYRVLLDEVD